MEDFEERLMRLIRDKSGINVSFSHRTFIAKFAQNRINELGISHSEYISKLESDNEELILVIDEAAINETYFFREEKQFDYLAKRVFRCGWKPVIWSAACSTGEEALSLYALAKHCGCDAEIYATDIDENAMRAMRTGTYPPHAFRTEGSSFFPILSEIGEYHPKYFKASPETLSKIHISKFNLVLDKIFPMQEESVDILFMRNVFIYFDNETRNEVIKKMCRALKKGGLLFISVNEIASVNCDESIPLVKDHWETIYFLRKISDEEKKEFLIKKTLRPKPANAANSGLKETQAVSTGNLTIEELYKKIKEKIDEGKTDDARKILSTANYRPDSADLILYLTGLIEMKRNNLDGAEKFFIKSSIINPEFWPAFFQLGMLGKENGNQKMSRDNFSKCSKVLKDYAKKKKMCYTFLMDSFSEDYFLKSCETFLSEEE